MKYVKWTRNDIDGLNMAFLATEIDDSGKVRCEIGVGEGGVVLHRFPSKVFRTGERGLFDLQLVETRNLEANMERGAFEALWGQKQTF